MTSMYQVDPPRRKTARNALPVEEHWTSARQLHKRLFVCFFILLFVLPGAGQNIQVTMRLNTATNHDTLKPHHIVQIRGEATGAVLPGITWGDDTGINFLNIGGDYWETTLSMAPGTEIKYKFWTGFSMSDPTFFWDGWEGPFMPPFGVDSGSNRYFVAGDKDTTLALQFYHGNDTNREQYWRPYDTKADSFVVFLRVNMASFIETGDFDPESDQVVVRGSRPLDPTDTWETNIPLIRETGSADNGAFYSGAGTIANADLAAGEWQNYKFVYLKGGVPSWESIDNRFFQYSGPVDTTIHWAYFNNQPPSGGNIVETVLTWQVKTDGIEKLGLMEMALNERIVVDGAKSWDIDNPIELTYDQTLQLWKGEETFVKAPGTILQYKSVLFWDAARIDESSIDWLPGLELTVPLQYWEEPCLFGSSNREYAFGTASEQMVTGDYGFDWQYFNGLPPEGVIETPMTITFNIDMTQAADVTINTENPLFRPGLDEVSVQFSGCLMPLTQEDGLYTNNPKPLSDNDGDLVYSGSLELFPPFPFDVGFRINYTTEAGGVVQNGGGTNYGRSYYQYIHPTRVMDDGTIEWPQEFFFPTLQWTPGDLTVEDPPDLWRSSSAVGSGERFSAFQFVLAQNYPNPFNPETVIAYEVGERNQVRIEIFNLEGRFIATLVNQEKVPGNYTISWNGKNQSGIPVTSGLYFIRMISGSFVRVGKMTLLR